MSNTTMDSLGRTWKLNDKFIYEDGFEGQIYDMNTGVDGVVGVWLPGGRAARSLSELTLIG